jgi:hypothetical protein
MRRILTSFAVAAVMAAIASLAPAGNQETAEQIAQNLRQRGQMSDYKIGGKDQNGTAWLRGRVNDEAQMDAALKVAFQTASVKRVVNELTIASEDAVPAPKAKKVAKTSRVNRADAAMDAEEGSYASPRAERVPSSYASAAAQKASMQESEGLPQRMAAPPRMKPMSANRVAMQDGPRGPTAPTGGPMPMYAAGANPANAAPARYDQPCMPNYAWPSYASYPNYAAVTYPKQYSPTAWPYIGPFYPYPQVPLGWRKVTLEWDDGWWFLDFKDQPAGAFHR